VSDPSIQYLLPFIIATIVSLLLVPMVRRFGFKTGRVSYPRRDRWNRWPTPTLGGIGMFVAFSVAILAGTLWYRQDPGHWNLLVGAMIMFVLGRYP